MDNNNSSQEPPKPISDIAPSPQPSIQPQDVMMDVVSQSSFSPDQTLPPEPQIQQPPPPKLKTTRKFNTKLLLLLPLIAVVGALSFFLWTKVETKSNSNQQQNETSNTSNDQPESNDEIASQAKSQECFSYKKDAPSASTVNVPDGFILYSSESGGFSIAQPKGWTATEDIKESNPFADTITCSDGIPRKGIVTFTSPKGSKIVVTVDGLIGGRGGDCVPEANDAPFKPGNYCPTVQNLGVVSSTTADSRLNYFIKNYSNALDEQCYDSAFKEAPCPDTHMSYVYKEKYANTLTNDDPKSEAPEYSLCLSTSQGVAASELSSRFESSAAKMGYYVSCAFSSVYDYFNADQQSGYRIGAYAQDADASTEASLTSDDMKLAATALASLRLN